VPSLAPYFVYQTLANTTFFQAVFIVFYQERAGLSLATVLWVQTYFTALRALLDVPFGALADRTSRRLCLVAGMLLPACASSLLVWSPTLAVVVVAETLFAAGTALRSGADSALLYDWLKDAGRLDDYPRAESRGQGVAALGSGTTAVLGALLAARDLRLPYVVTAIAGVVGACVAFGLRIDRRAHSARAAGRMRSAAALALASPVLLWCIGLAAFAVSASHVYYYLQQPYLRAIGVPVGAFGVVFAATKLVTAIIATRAPAVDAALGVRGALLVMAGVGTLGLAGMSAAMGAGSAVLGAALVLTRGGLDGLWMPLTNVWVNRLVPSELRATMLSLQSLVARLALASVIGLAGVATSHLGLGATLAAAATAVALVGAALLSTAPRLPARSRVIAE
jgi:MFS family permease